MALYLYNNVHNFGLRVSCRFDNGLSATNIELNLISEGDTYSLRGLVLHLIIFSPPVRSVWSNPPVQLMFIYYGFLRRWGVLFRIDCQSFTQSIFNVIHKPSPTCVSGVRRSVIDEVRWRAEGNKTLISAFKEMPYMFNLRRQGTQNCWAMASIGSSPPLCRGQNLLCWNLILMFWEMILACSKVENAPEAG